MHIVIITIIFYYYITIITCRTVSLCQFRWLSLLNSWNYDQCNHICLHDGVIIFLVTIIIIIIKHIILRLIYLLITILLIEIKK